MKIFDIKWQVNTAGPTPYKYNNFRTELFLFGCKKAMNGNPCKGCFNSCTWDDSIVEKTYTPKEVADNINKHAPNKYVTIGGGEPTDQLEELIELCIRLKEYEFNIMLYTWRNVNECLVSEDRDYYLSLFKNVDIIVDGEYDYTQRLYQEDKSDGFLNSIGSGNQTIWYKSVLEYSQKDLPMASCKMKHIDSLYMDNYDNIIINFKEEYLLGDTIK